jgi:hypothetical protein
MKPDWDELMDAYADSEQFLVGDVDCTTAEGKPLCGAHGVRGFPTIKWGDPSDLNDYKGGRDLASLKSFAEKNLKPICSPLNLDICDDDKKALIKEYQALEAAALDAAISKQEQELADAEAAHNAQVKELNDKFAEVKNEMSSSISLMKSVKATSNSGKDEL